MKSARILEPKSTWRISLATKPKTPLDKLIGKTINPIRIDKALSCEENNNGYVFVYRKESTCPDRYKILGGQPFIVIGSISGRAVPMNESTCPNESEVPARLGGAAGTPISLVITVKTDKSYNIVSINVGTYATDGPMRGNLINNNQLDKDLKPIAKEFRGYLIARSSRSKGRQSSGASSK